MEERREAVMTYALGYIFMDIYKHTLISPISHDNVN